MLMIKLTIQYIPISSDVAFLRIKQSIVTAVPFYLTVFYIHVYSSIFVISAGFTQFSNYLLRNKTVIHRYVGIIYAYTVLLLAAPSGITIGFYANGSWLTKISFILLGVLWFSFTLIATIAIKNRAIETHKNFMRRSYALALSAITLRAWKVIIVYTFHLPPMDTYKIIAWLGWVPNLLIVEYYITKKLYIHKTGIPK